MINQQSIKKKKKKESWSPQNRYGDSCISFFFTIFTKLMYTVSQQQHLPRNGLKCSWAQGYHFLTADRREREKMIAKQAPISVLHIVMSQKSLLYWEGTQDSNSCVDIFPEGITEQRSKIIIHEVPTLSRKGQIMFNMICLRKQKHTFKVVWNTISRVPSKWLM